MKRIALIAAGLVLLAGCMPAAQVSGMETEPVAIVVNGPREFAVPGLADALEQEMRSLPHCCGFDIHWSQPVRAQERQRDMYSHRAFSSTGSIARNLRAGWAVLAGANDYVREVTEIGSRLEIHVTAGVRLYITDDQGNELARFDSRSLQARRWQPADRELVSEGREPLLQELTEELLPEVAAPAVSFLNGRVAAQRK